MLEGKSPTYIFSELGKVGVVDFLGTFFEPNVETGNQQQVAGIYCYHVEGESNPGGATIVDQYWSYAFLNDGSFKTYLEGSQQFGGKWRQSGSDLSVTVDAIAGLSDSYTWHANVSSDGRTISNKKIQMNYTDKLCTINNH